MAVPTIRVVLNKSEIRAFLKSQELTAAIRPFAERIKGRADMAAPDGHEVKPLVGHDRTSMVVHTVTPEAMVAEMTTRNLSKSVEAGRA